MNQPPPQPKYILRGHSAHITALRFCRRNTRLLTADADGWLIVWSLSTKRPVAVWKAHEQTVLGIEDWNEDYYLTHGREQKIIVWQLPVRAENELSTAIPGERPAEHVKQPWLLHSLRIRGSGFCPFAVCSGYPEDSRVNDETPSLLIAAPGGEKVVDIITLPNEKTLHNVYAPKNVKTGMIMTMKLTLKNNNLLLCTGYESGYVIVQALKVEKNEWQAIQITQSHYQPVLSIDLSPNLQSYFSCAADSVIAKHPLFEEVEIEESSPYDYETCARKVTTGHTGQQLVRVRSDGRILATAGWDGRIRIYSAETLKELAVLIWHKQGCYTVDFASVACDASSKRKGNPDTQKNSLILHTTSTKLVHRREMQAQSVHWIAAGSKDGKVSLWDIY